ncbi:DUF4386 domain-containing protein [Corynebacterium crudilactis]|uniref:DUF4386 domain-containing protein n=1 Tax=Corynebacterium crudilactis TaxID=1652495 RepID=UPI00093DB227|nr:DUF4386 domain-containing protein [Corynebacterium crudilactis]
MDTHQSAFRLAAGFSLLTMAIISPIGFLVALPQGLFSLTAIVGFIVATLDIAVALLLFPILKSGGFLLSIVISLLRIIYSIGLYIATIILIASSDGGQFIFLWDRILGIFGLHLLLCGIALWRSPNLPTPIGILLVLAGGGYAFDALMVFLNIETITLSEFTFIGEVILLIWLMWSGFQASKISSGTPSGFRPSLDRNS